MLIDPELQLTPEQRGDFMQIVHSRGFAIIQLLMQSIVEQARVDLDNANPANPAEVMSKHAISRASGIVYTKFMERVNQEVRASDEMAQRIPYKPGEDVTQVLGMDSIEQITENFPNFFGDAQIAD